MEKTNANRFTTNYIMWLANFEKIYGKDSEVLRLCAEELIEAKSHLPKYILDRTGLSMYNSVEELMANQCSLPGEKPSLAHIILLLCNSSIYNSAVYVDKKEGRREYCYIADVDNIILFPQIIITDFVVNAWTLSQNISDDDKLVMVVKLDPIKIECDKEGYCQMFADNLSTVLELVCEKAKLIVALKENS